MIIIKIILMALKYVPNELIETQLIPYILNINIKTIDEEHKLLHNILYILNLICSCKKFSNIDGIWKTITLLIYPKNYIITENSIHNFKPTWSSCGWRWYLNDCKKNNECAFRFNFQDRNNYWVTNGCKCNDISHYDINTLECNDKDFIKQKRNFKKILLSKLRTNIEKNKIFLLVSDNTKYKNYNHFIDKYETQYNNYINKTGNSMFELQIIENYEAKIKFIKNYLEKLEYKKQLLTRLNYTIDGTKNKKFNSYVNFIKSQKSLLDYNFTTSKEIWSNMSQIEKNKYKSI